MMAGSPFFYLPPPKILGVSVINPTWCVYVHQSVLANVRSHALQYSLLWLSDIEKAELKSVRISFPLSWKWRPPCLRFIVIFQWLESCSRSGFQGSGALFSFHFGLLSVNHTAMPPSSLASSLEHHRALRSWRLTSLSTHLEQPLAPEHTRCKRNVAPLAIRPLLKRIGYQTDVDIVCSRIPA